MVNRFKGAEGERLAYSLLIQQYVINGNEEIAKKVISAGQIAFFKKGEFLIKQGATDNSIYFILSGSTQIDVNGSIVAVRKNGYHVGEMALIDPNLHRSATVIAAEEVVAFNVSEPAFSHIAEEHPIMWRRLAIELARRLHERNKFVRQQNDRINVFLGSSSESLDIAMKMHALLAHGPYTIRLWKIGVFEPSNYPLEDLLLQTKKCDFALLVVSNDDMVTSRKILKTAPRDNIVFETGLFMGSIGRERTIMVKPKGIDIKIPSDLMGITMFEFDISNLDDSLSCTCKIFSEYTDRIGLK
jgi:predicted nucleotide-binding protein